MHDRKTLTVATELGDVVVSRMAIGAYAEMLKRLDKLPASLASIFDQPSAAITTDFLAGVIPQLAADLIPELCAVVSCATDVNGDFIEQLDLADLLDVIDAILVLNDIHRIVAAIKKIQARIRPAGLTVPPAEKTSAPQKK